MPTPLSYQAHISAKGIYPLGILFWLFVALIIYTYAGYPFLLALLSLVWHKPVPTDSGGTCSYVRVFLNTPEICIPPL